MIFLVFSIFYFAMIQSVSGAKSFFNNLPNDKKNKCTWWSHKPVQVVAVLLRASDLNCKDLRSTYCHCARVTLRHHFTSITYASKPEAHISYLVAEIGKLIVLPLM